MKKLKTIGLVLTLLFGILTTTQSQTTTTSSKETKRQMLENLIGARNFLTFSSNTQFSSDTRLATFNWAIDYYNDFKKAYEKLKSTLPTDIKSDLEGIMNVYGQVCTEKGFQYLTDIGTATALSICFAKIEKVTESMLK